MMAARGYLDTATIPRKAKTTTAVLRVETVKNTNPPPNKSDASWAYVLFAERRDDASSCGWTAPGKGRRIGHDADAYKLASSCVSSSRTRL